MSSLALYEGDFRNWLPKVVESFGEFKMLFADPPDNIDWGYVIQNIAGGCVLVWDAPL